MLSKKLKKRILQEKINGQLTSNVAISGWSSPNESNARYRDRYINFNEALTRPPW